MSGISWLIETIIVFAVFGLLTWIWSQVGSYLTKLLSTEVVSNG